MGYKHNDDCLNKTADDEPIFVLCARDITAPVHVDAWAELAEKLGARPEKVAEARECASRMREWAATNSTAKVPD